jgi:TM2 domain-containing membrane protein YozV
MYCSNCGIKNDDAARFCSSCGSSIASNISTPNNIGTTNQDQPMHNGFQMINPSTPPKSPLMAVFLSFMLIGVGQFYLGQKKKFIAAIMIGFISFISGVLLPLAWLVWLIHLFDAYFIGKKLEAGHAVGEWEYFPTNY